MELAISSLGLAAYLDMLGVPLLRIEPKRKLFVFETEKPYKEWSQEYDKSCCRRHDLSVCHLRDKLRAIKQLD